MAGFLDRLVVEFLEIVGRDGLTGRIAVSRRHFRYPRAKLLEERPLQLTGLIDLGHERLKLLLNRAGLLAFRSVRPEILVLTRELRFQARVLRVEAGLNVAGKVFLKKLLFF